ncbi:signal peptidase I [Leucobacter aridicollis]|uniref:signal peptidase I n=1 Tax=Leucobacter aridicollis TaxID=283878 RepID=UPI0021066B3E|nr:signal peptidase I [Leucobacter aridicollis]UTX52630.1 signal peptidase I [Leucobacter aridicollis]
MRARSRAMTGFLLAAGVVLIALLSAQVAGIKLYGITSGSMDPTISEGALIVTKRVPAADIAVGDIVTVQRSAGSRTVTHRVIHITLGAAPDQRELTLQGDANATPDPSIYTVGAVQRYLFTIIKE